MATKDIENLKDRVNTILLDFKAEGVLKKAVFKHGDYHDIYLCALLKN